VTTATHLRTASLVRSRGRLHWLASALAVVGTACASAATVIPVERAEPPVPLDQRVAWTLRLEAQRQLRDSGLPDAAAAMGDEGSLLGALAVAPARAPDLAILVRDLEPTVRARAALAIGRVGQAAGVPLLIAALADDDAVVRGEAAFGLGLLGRVEAEAALRAALTDVDVRVRGRAAEGLGLIASQLSGPEAETFRHAVAGPVGEAFASCGAFTQTLAPDDDATPVSDDLAACQLAIFALARLRDFDALARVVLTPEGRPLSAWWPVAYALQRVGGPRALAPLAELARGSGVYAAAFAMRSVAATADGLPIAQRFALDDSADPRVRVSAIRGLGRRGSVQSADTLMTLLQRRGLSATLTLEAMAALAVTEDSRALDMMLDRLTDSRPQIRAAAVAGVARIDPDSFLLVVSSLGPDPDFRVRAALATTLGTLEPDRVRSGLIDLTDDQDQRVRGPALEALARVGAPDLVARLFAALDAPDFWVRATAARIVGTRKPSGAVPALTDAYERGKSDAVSDGRIAALEALAEVGTDDALQVVRSGLADRDWPVRLRAAALLGAVGDVAEPERPAPVRQSASFFESAALLHPEFSPVALVETRHGTIEIALNVVDAPLTTFNFVELARAGFFNGLRVHVLTPNFIVQTGDPRGDGEGGPGYSISDELSALPYRRGTVGMATDGPDRAGSQFFITHSPQPHLNGRYTVFGQVVKGLDVVDQLSLYDVIDRIRIWDGVVLK